MKKVYFTITGAGHYYGYHFFKPDMEVRLEKEPGNDFDKEAIKVMLEGLGVVGYVANSPYTVIGECMSAGRIYDRIRKRGKGIVRYVLPQGVVCELVEKSGDEE